MIWKQAASYRQRVSSKAPTGMYCQFPVLLCQAKEREHKGPLGLISQVMSSNEIWYISAALFEKVDTELALRQ